MRIVYDDECAHKVRVTNAKHQRPVTHGKAEINRTGCLIIICEYVRYIVFFLYLLGWYLIRNMWFGFVFKHDET